MKILWRRIARNRENRGFGREGASEKQKGEKKIVWVRGARVSRAKPVATGKRRASIAVSPLEDARPPQSHSMFPYATFLLSLLLSYQDNCRDERGVRDRTRRVRFTWFTRYKCTK